MRRIWIVFFVVFGFGLLDGCEREVVAPPSAAPVKAVAPLRGASGDLDLRVMLAEIASTKACGMIQGTFIGLREADQPVTGVLWIRECEITNVDAHVTFHITGTGWLWVDQTKSKAGGSFSVRQYVRFSIGTTIRGALDIAYDREAHVATLWFTPDRAPDVEFKTIGDIDVDRDGVWSSVIGALGTAFATSPEDLALSAATSEGTRDLDAQFSQGLSVTLNLCTGLRRVQLGRPSRGVMGPADVGETRRASVEVQPGGVMIIGPQIADDGMTLKADAQRGAVRLTLVCAKHAETVAAEFIDGRITSKVPVLGTVDVRTTSKLRIKPTSCPVMVVVSPLDNAPARFAWERPTAEIAHSTGGPLVHCRAKQKPSKATR